MYKEFQTSQKIIKKNTRTEHYETMKQVVELWVI